MTKFDLDALLVAVSPAVVAVVFHSTAMAQEPFQYVNERFGFSADIPAGFSPQDPPANAIPGGSGDAPGWVVLRDADGGIRGIVDLSMVQAYRGAAGATTHWERDRVVVPLSAELPLVPASGPVARWVGEQMWRLRARLGLVPTDDMFR